jgi:hypothetical protein
VIKQIMDVAFELGMTSNEYLYIFYALTPSDWHSQPWTLLPDENLTYVQAVQRKEAFKVFRTVSVVVEETSKREEPLPV